MNNTDFTELDKTHINNAISRMSANVSNYVKKLKQNAGNISSRELSRRTGVSIAVISDMEGNKYLPKMEVLLKLASGMGDNFLNLMKELWNWEDVIYWAKLTKTPLPMPEDMNENEFLYKSDYPTLKEMLHKEGLTKNDVAEVLEFIEFKRARQKRR